MADESPGKDWPDVSYRESSKTIQEKARARLSYLVVVAAIVFVVGTVAYGLGTNEWGAFRMATFAAWIVVWPIIGWYFGHNHQGRGDDLDSF
jgi:hypothetical protein